MLFPTPIERSHVCSQTLHSRGGIFNIILDHPDRYKKHLETHRGRLEGNIRDSKPTHPVSVDMGVPSRSRHPSHLRIVKAFAHIRGFSSGPKGMWTREPWRRPTNYAQAAGYHPPGGERALRQRSWSSSCRRGAHGPSLQRYRR